MAAWTNGHTSSWTDERVALLKRLWADGISASQISNRIPGTTRNAIIAKANRLKLAMRAPRGNRSPRRRHVLGFSSPRAGVLTSQAYALDKRVLGELRPKMSKGGGAKSFGVFAPSPIPTTPQLIIPPIQRKKLEDLEPRCCRWPFEDVGHPEFGFCGRKSELGLPYCEDHARVAYPTLAIARRDAEPVTKVHELEPA